MTSRVVPTYMNRGGEGGERRTPNRPPSPCSRLGGEYQEKSSRRARAAASTWVAPWSSRLTLRASASCLSPSRSSWRSIFYSCLETASIEMFVDSSSSTSSYCPLSCGSASSCKKLLLIWERRGMRAHRAFTPITLKSYSCSRLVSTGASSSTLFLLLYLAVISTRCLSSPCTRRLASMDYARL